MQQLPSLAYSGEIRWFVRGDAPPALRAWFEGSAQAATAPLRIDEYVALPGCDTAGIKLREGRLEVKSRVVPPAAVSYGAAVAGRRDGWVKWSRAAPDAAALRALVTNPADDWVFVAKERCLRRFERRDRRFAEIGPAEFPAAGYQVELTTIRAMPGRQDGSMPTPSDFDAADPWWSVCVESFGAPGIVIEQLDAAMQHLQAGGFSATLPPSASLAYPAWLAQFYAR